VDVAIVGAPVHGLLRLAGKEAPLQCGLVQRRDAGRIQAGGGQAHVLGHAALGQAQGGGDLLVRLANFEFQTQCVL